MDLTEIVTKGRKIPWVSFSKFLQDIEGATAVALPADLWDHFLDNIPPGMVKDVPNYLRVLLKKEDVVPVNDYWGHINGAHIYTDFYRYPLDRETSEGHYHVVKKWLD